MNRNKLSKIKVTLRGYRKSPQGVSSADLVGLAKKLGRSKSTASQHPTYVREAAPTLFPPLSIPAHPGDLMVRTVCIIVDHLLDDVQEWEMFLSEDDDATDWGNEI